MKSDESKNQEFFRDKVLLLLRILFQTPQGPIIMIGLVKTRVLQKV